MASLESMEQLLNVWQGAITQSLAIIQEAKAKEAKVKKNSL